MKKRVLLRKKPRPKESEVEVQLDFDTPTVLRRKRLAFFLALVLLALLAGLAAMALVTRPEAPEMQAAASPPPVAATTKTAPIPTVRPQPAPTKATGGTAPTPVSGSESKPPAKTGPLQEKKEEKGAPPDEPASAPPSTTPSPFRAVLAAPSKTARSRTSTPRPSTLPSSRVHRVPKLPPPPPPATCRAIVLGNRPGAVLEAGGRALGVSVGESIPSVGTLIGVRQNACLLQIHGRTWTLKVEE